MVSASKLRQLALALEGTIAAPHFDRTAFKVVRIYATLGAGDRDLNLKLSPDQQEFKCMMAPAIFKPIVGGWGRQGWTSVDLEAISHAELAAALQMAWEHGRARKTR